MVSQKHSESGVHSETLTIPELEQSKAAVLNTLASIHSRRSYAFAIDSFITWYCSEPRQQSGTSEANRSCRTRLTIVSGSHLKATRLNRQQSVRFARETVPESFV
ncbi:MAG: phage integrase family protein [Bryobacterales bacterium]|nr:phage integrase family protein [Bryobacterales bacterium]